MPWGWKPNRDATIRRCYRPYFKAWRRDAMIIVCGLISTGTFAVVAAAAGAWNDNVAAFAESMSGASLLIAVYGGLAFAFAHMDRVEGFRIQLEMVEPSLTRYDREHLIRRVSVLLQSVLVGYLLSPVGPDNGYLMIWPVLALMQSTTKPDLLRLMLCADRLADAAGLPTLDEAISHSAIRRSSRGRESV